MPLGFGKSVFARQAAVAGGRSTVITLGGDIQVDTARSKFGGASALFDGTNDAIRFAPDSSVMAHPYTGAFTIEFFFNVDQNPGAFASLPLVNRLGGGFGAREFMVLIENLNIRIAYNAWNGTDPIQNLNLNGSGSFAMDTWHHLAWGYDGVDEYSVWLNGTRFHNVTTTYSNHQLTATGFQLGGFGSVTNVANDYHNGTDGWIDEFRVSKVDRYGVTNSSITVPTSAFTNDSDTVVLCHFDGSDGSTTFEDDDA